MARPTALLFDLDCTLTDRPATIAAFAMRFVRHFGAGLRWGAEAGSSRREHVGSPESTVASVIAGADANGYAPRHQLFARLRRDLPWARDPEPDALAHFWAEVFPACTRPAAGLHETLLGLRDCGVRLGVVSNGGAVAQQRKIDALGIRPQLSAVVISATVGVRKPDPVIFRLALDRIGARAADCWFVGDHPDLDVGGARSAGLRPVWLRGVHPWPTELPAPEAQIDRLPALLNLL